MISVFSSLSTRENCPSSICAVKSPSTYSITTRWPSLFENSPTNRFFSSLFNVVTGSTLSFVLKGRSRTVSTASNHISPAVAPDKFVNRSEEHTSELQSRGHLVCRLLLEKKKKRYYI